MTVYAGTSGYSYKEWKGDFYPEDLPAKGMLSYYAERLPAVEINNTFYRLPKREVLEGWAEQTPESFRFVIKASRRITHMKRLKDTGDETGYLLETVQSLGDRLGALLFQLPPQMKRDDDRLGAFLELLPGGTRASMEFRHDSWYTDEVYELLRRSNVALCTADASEEGGPAPIVATADWGYLRLRRLSYTDDELAAWARGVSDQSWSDAYVFFKHEDDAHGVRMAQTFLDHSGS